MPKHENQLGVAILTIRNDYATFPNRNHKPLNPIATNRQCANLCPTLPTEEYALSPKKMYPYLNRQVTGEAVEFEPKAEPWSQYTLADGSEEKVKLVLLNAIRLDEFNEQGEPVYQFQFQQIIGVVAPDALKRKAQ